MNHSQKTNENHLFDLFYKVNEEQRILETP
jgi:hypothetical protein